MAKQRRAMTEGTGTRIESLRRHSKNELAKLLAELADRHPVVEEWLNRHALASDPARLAADFQARLRSWKRSSRYWGRDARAFGRTLEIWLDEIECELLPLAPKKAFELADSFLKSDRHFFEQADDSDGVIGDAIRAGCQLWLRAAKVQSNCDAAYWIGRMHALVRADEYGARDALLVHADLLLDAAGLRGLANRFEADLNKALCASSTTGKLEFGVFRAASAIGLIADALGDPDLSINTTLRYSPEPNQLQKAQFAERYIRYGRPGDALAWLEGDWGIREDARERLLADAYAGLGDTARLRTVRQALFERTGTTYDFEAWCQSLGPEQREWAVAAARDRAKRHSDPIAAAQLLLSLDDDEEAEAVLIVRQVDVDGAHYSELVSLARMLEQKGRVLGPIICYRALLVSILSRGYARAYHHAAEYLNALRRLDARVVSYGSLSSHQTFESSIRAAHGRKVSFWSRIRG